MKLKILHIGTSDMSVLTDMGGALQRRILAMARIQALDGHEVTILSPSDSDKLVMDHGVRIELVSLRSRPPLRAYEFLLRSRLRVRSHETYDIMHAHGSPNAARILATCARAAVQSVDFHRYGASGGHIGRRYYTSNLNRFDAILPVSEYCAAEFQQYFPNVSSTIAVLANGVDTVEFRPDHQASRDARNALGLPDEKLVVYLGRVCEQKGSDLLGPLAESLRRSHPGVTVVAAGPPEAFGRGGTSELMTSLQRSGVICTGAVPERHLRGLLNAAFISVLPTRCDEMFGMAALEACACGTAVVASDLGGIPEAVGPCGRLFAAGDAAAFIRQIENCLDDLTFIDSVRSAGPTHAEAFSWRTIVDQADDIYRQVLRSK